MTLEAKIKELRQMGKSTAVLLSAGESGATLRPHKPCDYCGNSSVVERLVANEKVAGPIPVSRSKKS